MKKILTIFLTLSLLFAVPLSACNDGEVIEVNEVTHSVFYCPLYVALENKYFEEEGLKVNLTNGGGSDATMTAVLSGSAQIGLAGPETAIYVYNQGKADYPVVFGQLTKRDGSFLVARTAQPNFQWTDLANKEIIAGRRGGMPAMTFEYICNQNGLYNGTNVNLNLDVAFNLMVGAFESGVGDYCTMFEPTASEFQAEGKGYIVASVGEASGDVPYTAFIAKPSYINNNEGKIKSFMKAMKKAYDFIANSTEEQVAQAVVKQFPSSSINSLATAIKQYKSINAWVDNMQPTEASYTTLQNILQNSGELTNRVEFSKLVNLKYAQEVFG